MQRIAKKGRKRTATAISTGELEVEGIFNARAQTSSLKTRTSKGIEDISLKVTVQFVPLHISDEGFSLLDDDVVQERDRLIESLELGAASYTLQGPEVSSLSTRCELICQRVLFSAEIAGNACCGLGQITTKHELSESNVSLACHNGLLSQDRTAYTLRGASSYLEGSPGTPGDLIRNPDDYFYEAVNLTGGVFPDGFWRSGGDGQAVAYIENKDTDTQLIVFWNRINKQVRHADFTYTITNAWHSLVQLSSCHAMHR